MVDSEFKRLKERDSAEALKKLQRAASFSVAVGKGSHYRTRVFDSLHLVTDGSTMRDCMNEKTGAELCGSLFCDRCRERRQSSIFSTFKDYTEKQFGGDEDAARDRLRFVSVLHSLVAVEDLDTMAAAFASIEEVKTAVSEMKSILALVKKKAKRKHNADIWLRGGVHIELIDFDLFLLADAFGKGTVKTDTINSFIHRYSAEKKFSTQNGKFFLVHFHALADKKDLSDKDFRRLFEERWSLTKKQVHIQRTWKTIKFKNNEAIQSLDDGLLGMARYCFNGSNGRLTFAQNWGAGSIVFRTGESVDAKGHVVGFAEEVMGRDADERLSIGDVALLVEAHNQVNGDSHKGLLIAIY
jgi:hypothetical protein